MSNSSHIVHEEFRTAGVTWLLINGYYTGLLSISGVIGNLLTIFIFSRPKFRNSINCILVGLAVSDTLVLITVFIFLTIPEMLIFYFIELPYLHGVRILYVQVTAYTLFCIGVTATTLLTVGISAERYLAVCFPLKARVLGTWGTARLVLIGIFIYSVLVNCIRPLFYEIQYTEVWNPNKNSTSVHNDLGYSDAPIWLRKLIVTIIPGFHVWASLILLGFFNFRIYMEIRRANKVRATLSSQQQESIKVAKMLIGIVIVFLMTNLSKVLYWIIQYAFNTSGAFFFKLSNPMYATNSAVNFYIYILKVKQFRIEVVKIMVSALKWLGINVGSESRRHLTTITSTNITSESHL